MFSKMFTGIVAICLLGQFCESKELDDQKIIKALDFSLGSDNNNYATLKKGNLPAKFTLCGAFMVEGWGENTNSPLFILKDEDEITWFYVELYAVNTDTHYTEFTITFQSSNDQETFTQKSSSIFFPMQWTRFCLSFDTKTRKAIFVVDGDVIVEREIAVTEKPINLNLQLGSYLGLDSHGRMTDVNIFSYIVSNT